MDLDIDSCSICQNKNSLIKNINCSIDDKLKPISKLKLVAPEKGWLDIFSICYECEKLLDITYDFLKTCEKFESLRNDFIKRKVEQCSYEPNSPVQNEKDYQIIYEDEPSNHSDNFEELVDSRIQEVKIHIKSENPKNNLKFGKFQCDKCGEFFSLLKHILDHSTKAHQLDPKDVKPYSCKSCNSKFATSSSLIQHTKYHEGKRSYMCTVCGKSFITTRDLAAHKKSHDNERRYKCDQCNKTFNTSQNLRTHIYAVHTDSNQWKFCCKVCSKRFAMKANFNEHVKRHQGVKSYSCQFCKKSFVSKNELQKHIKCHSNISEYECVNCNKNYRDKRSFHNHLAKIHAVGKLKSIQRVKKFVCHVCPSQFSDKTKLQRHIRTHTGIKPFSCQGCDKKFIDKSYLTHHLKTVHDVNNSLKAKAFSQTLELV